jgi:SAM-dependent methyltransferase
MYVLKKKSEIEKARVILKERNISCTDTWLERFIRIMRLSGDLPVGDEVKSWDVLKTIQFIEENIGNHSEILDIGAYASEIPCILHRLGYINIKGIDLNAEIKRMPHADSIKYIVSDFMKTPFKEGSFRVITAISVIEHGFIGSSLFSEISRILCPGGYFLASFDYWKDKIDTSGVILFGLDWKIFSYMEVKEILCEASKYNLFPYGSIDYEVNERPIEFMGKNYTFALMILKKIG